MMFGMLVVSLTSAQSFGAVSKVMVKGFGSVVVKDTSKVIR